MVHIVLYQVLASHDIKQHYCSYSIYSVPDTVCLASSTIEVCYIIYITGTCCEAAYAGVMSRHLHLTLVYPERKGENYVIQRLTPSCYFPQPLILEFPAKLKPSLASWSQVMVYCILYYNVGRVSEETRDVP